MEYWWPHFGRPAAKYADAVPPPKEGRHTPMLATKAEQQRGDERDEPIGEGRARYHHSGKGQGASRITRLGANVTQGSPAEPEP